MISTLGRPLESKSGSRFAAQSIALALVGLLCISSLGATTSFDRFVMKYGNPVRVYVVVENDQGIFNPTTLASVLAIGEQLAGIAGVESVDTPLNAQVVRATPTTLAVAPAAAREEVPSTAAGMTMLSHALLSSPFHGGIAAAQDGTACAILVTLARDADCSLIASRAEEIVDPFRDERDMFHIYSDAGLADGPVVAGAVNILDRSFAGSVRLLVEIDTGTRNGMKSLGTLDGIVQLEELLYDHGARRVISLATLVREMNRAFHGLNPAQYVLPESEQMVSQLLLLYAFQGGLVGPLSMADDSSGTLVGYFTPTSEDPSDVAALELELTVAVQDLSPTVFDPQVEVAVLGVLHTTPIRTSDSP